MKQIFHILIILSLMLPFAGEALHGSSTKNESPVSLLSTGNNVTTIKVISQEDFIQTPVKTPQGNKVTISMPEGVPIMEKGSPDLAKLTTTLVIPDMHNMQIRITSSSYTEYSNIHIAPSKGHISRSVDPSTVPFVYGDVYQRDEFWPADLVQADEPFIFRDVRGQTFNIFPFSYNPVKNVLRVYSDITFEVYPAEEAVTNPLKRVNHEVVTDPQFLDMYQRLFSNFSSFQKNYPIIEEDGSMLIICYDEFLDEMLPFAEWKITTGRKVEMVPVSEAGDTPHEIKSYISDYYNNNPDFTYLLLVGDAPDRVPVVHLGVSSGHSDNWYGFLEGNDAYNEIIIGRLSAQTPEHVQTQVQRLIHYERDIDETDTWLDYGMGIARNEGTGGGHMGGENDYEHMDFIRDSLLNYTYQVIYREYDHNVPNTPNTTPARISTGINQGVGIINYCNHGLVDGWTVADYNNDHVNALENTNRLPFIWSVACVNGAFVGQYSFAEAWMWATHQGEPAGAIGTLMSTINQSWIPPMTAQDEMVTILVEQRPYIRRTFGGISLNGSMKMVADYGSDGRINHETWVLFGDPSLMVRTSAPQPMEVSYEQYALVGTANFTVHSDAEGARVGISSRDYEGNLHLLGSAVVENGQAVVYFEEPLEQPGHLTVAVMGYNKITYLSEVEIIPPEGPFITLKSFTIIDADGNHVDEASYGATVSFNLEIENIGNALASGVELLIGSNSDHISIIEGVVQAGEIPPGSTLTIQDAFEVKIDENIPDGQRIDFSVDFTLPGDFSMRSPFHILVNAPSLIITDFYIDDSFSGNDNGIWDPGEVAELVFSVKNTGSLYSPSLKARASEINHNLMFPANGMQIGVLQSGEEITFRVPAISYHGVMPETTELFVLELYEGNYLFEKELQVTIGQLPVFLMDGNHFFSTCMGVFYDSGGPDGNYGNNENYQVSFFASQPGSQMIFVFDEFEIEPSYSCNYDYLHVYNGPNNNFPLIGTFCGSSIPDTIKSDNDQGALTFHFVSDHSDIFAGWKARFWCTDQPFEFHGISAFPKDMCFDEQAYLSAMVSGATESTTFSWSPAGSLSDPSSATPVAFPDETTEYTLVIENGGESFTETVTIAVHALPEPDLGDNQLSCRNHPVTLDAGPGYASYMWSDGSQNQTITLDYYDILQDEITVWVTVTTNVGCQGWDDVNIVFDECLTTDNQPEGQGLQVYPNPSRGRATVVAPENGTFSLILTDINGRTMISEQFDSTANIDLTGFAPGVYFIRVIQDHTIYTERIQVLK